MQSHLRQVLQIILQYSQQLFNS